MAMLVLLMNGVALGLGAAAPIGPVNVEIARRTLRYGRWGGILLGCGAVTVDVGYAVVTSVTFIPIREYPRLTAGLSVAGGIFLGYLAFLCLRGAFKKETVGERVEAAGEITPLPRWRHYLTGLLMTALNPMTLGFWFLAVPGAVAGLTAQPRIDLPMVCAGVFVGALSWVCFFTWLIGHLRRFGGEGWVRWIDLAGGLMLLAFALRAIWRVAGGSI